MSQAPLGWIARLSIGKKLVVAFGLILLLLIGSFSATLVYLSRVNSYVDRHQRITIPGVITASEMLRNVSDIDHQGVFWFNPATGRWVQIAGDIDRERKIVTAPLSHFSEYKCEPAKQSKASW